MMGEIFETQVFIESLKKHDHHSFTCLFNETGGKIFNLAYRMIGNEEDASDITQNTFLQVYQHIDSFRGDSRLSTWIFAIARNQCFQRLNQTRRTTFDDFEKLIENEKDEACLDELTEPEKQHLILQVKEGCLTGLVRCLPFNQRMAFILHILLHLPVIDVSMILNKSTGATKVLIHRSKKNLKQFLCKNCSLYHPDNACRCENLIGFSIKNNWIFKEKNKDQTLPDAKVIEDEVQNFKEIIRFYQDLSPANPSQELPAQIKTLIQNKNWEIFNPKKSVTF